ncbi:NADPH-dependent 7-cyano-7-deazaguanine reductase QueF [Legionella tunisiensis]|uniref:NADPH-dependent 7-cyano-7-deazaguanine reductase QueF n=1 Tax=Legionella tunisiensis TaxID=1034944 RepID=UPI0002EACBC4|nr:NADPH-dependent 7-cyano-7-deazaguanine reductase QueF [Legionella tunisiensis]
MSEHYLHASPLGRRSAYIDNYDNSLLFPIARQTKREGIGIGLSLPFTGYDIWTAFELSWLNQEGKPVVAVADIIMPCESVNLIESKSLKLYLNSFNNTIFDSAEAVQETIACDLSKAAGSVVQVVLYKAEGFIEASIGRLEGVCLDELDISCSEYKVNPRLLNISTEKVENVVLYSHLLKSNCLMTGQPDWGSISITYSGPRINNESLLQYLVSFRNHNEFHEQCVERIFMDLTTYCQPDELTVYARYTRRGGLDINPIRSTKPVVPPANIRLYRQ